MLGRMRRAEVKTGQESKVRETKTMKRIVLVLSLFAMLATGSGFAGDYWSKTCYFVAGPKAGWTEYFPYAWPVPVGDYCQDGFGSWGYAIPDFS